MLTNPETLARMYAQQKKSDENFLHVGRHFSNS